ncbi:ABC transporter permease [Ostreibacterium oceani]|uniref:Transport permease protein n=1 Tax=Ostreibacterium oceani TaxID=2654998 RepID=A0A6N7EZI9_9GAMM|nr:ABC transporter permease [Ostreibacterium oceani]MPV86980.1 ABC transporter permease [Ostreibacterium oceani]
MNKRRMQTNWVAYATLTRREIRRFIRIWGQTLIPPVITTSLYFLIFGKLIGDRVGQVDGVSYIEYIAPGLIMMAVIMNAYANVSSSFFGTKFHNNIEEQLVSPMPDSLIVLGYVTGGVLRGLVVGLIVAVVALFFTHISVVHGVLTILVAVLTAIVFSFAGFLNGLYAKSFDDVSIIPTFVLGPLTYLGGIFYSVSMLSESWQTVAKFNPLLYVINGFRYAMLGFSDVSFYTTIGVLLVLSVVMFIVAVHLMKHSSGVRG